MATMLLTSALYEKAEAGRITSRIGISAVARLYSRDDDLYALIAREHRRKKRDCILVDEAQFLTRKQVWELARVADRLDIPVMCFGLRTDFKGQLFEGSSELLAIADSLREIRTICHCGRKATMVVRRNADGRALTEGEQVSIEKSIYVSLCRPHWEEETGRWPPEKAKKTAARASTQERGQKRKAKAAKAQKVAGKHGPGVPKKQKASGLKKTPRRTA